MSADGTTEARLAAVEAEAAELKELLRVARRRVESLELGHRMAATLATSALGGDVR